MDCVFLGLGAPVHGQRGAVSRLRQQTLATIVCCLVVATLESWPSESLAADAVKASTSRKHREEAARAIPWQQLDNQQRGAVQRVVRNASLYRRLPIRVVDCDPQMFTFLAQHPEVIVDTWRVMGVSQVKVQRLGNAGFKTTDGAGTSGAFRFLDATWNENAFNRAVIYAEGQYEGKPFSGPIKARCVMLLRSGSVEETNHRTYVTVRLDSFIEIEQLGIELVAKTVHPLVGRTADQNFVETLKFVSNFSRTAERNPAGMEEFAGRLINVEPTTRDELVTVCYETADRYSDRKEMSSQRQPAIAQRKGEGTFSTAAHSAAK